MDRVRPPKDFPKGVPREARMRPIANDTLRFWVSWLIQRLLLFPAVVFLYKVVHRVEVRGWENLDRLDGRSFLICPNHTSGWDGPVSSVYAFSTPARFLDTGCWWMVLADPARMVFRVVMYFCIFMGVVPVDRKSGIEQFCLQDAMRLLTSDERRCVLTIYPEGTRSRDGKLARKGRLGAGWFQRRSGVPVLPVFHVGAPAPPRFGRRIKVWIGEPMELEEFQEMPDDPATWYGVTKAIMARLREMEAAALAEIEEEGGENTGEDSSERAREETGEEPAEPDDDSPRRE